MLTAVLFAGFNMAVEKGDGLEGILLVVCGYLVLRHLFLFEDQGHRQTLCALVDREGVRHPQIARDDRGPDEVQVLVTRIERSPIGPGVQVAQLPVKPRDQHRAAQEVQGTDLVRERHLIGHNGGVEHDVEGRLEPVRRVESGCGLGAVPGGSDGNEWAGVVLRSANRKRGRLLHEGWAVQVSE